MPTPPTVRTIALTVNLESAGDVVEQVLPGLSHTFHSDGDQLVVVSSLHQPFFSPLPQHERSDFSKEFSGLVTAYQVTAEGLVETAATKIPFLGTSVARGNDLFVASTKQSDIVDWVLPFWGEEMAGEDTSVLPPREVMPPTVSVARYAVGGSEIPEVASVELGPGFLVHFEVAEDGLTGVAVYQHLSEEGASTTVSLLDLADQGIEVVESIGLAGTNSHVVLGGPDYVVLKNWRDETLVIINADQSIDLSAEDRIQTVTLPNGIKLDHGSLRIGDRLVLRGQSSPADESLEGDSLDGNSRPESEETDSESRSWEPGWLSHLTLTPGSEDPTVFVVVSLPDSEVLSESQLPEDLRAVSYESLVLIDSDSQRFGFVAQEARPDSADGRRRPFGETQWVFGRLTESGDFQRDGSIPMRAWLEVDATPERLVVRLADHIEQYDWDQPSEPVIVPLPRPLPPLEAVNDQFRRRDHGRDQFFNVLANDLVGRRATRPPVKIVELIGAPEGTEVVRGRAIKIPAAAFQNVESLQFEYVISDGTRDSQAVVEISVVGLREPQVKELVDAVLQQASEDYEVSLPEVKVRSVERLFDQRLPLELPGGPIDLDWLPGVLVVLEVGKSKALYAADLDGQVVRLVQWQRDHLAELSVSAIDSQGKPMTKVREGDELFLQLRAKDLRDSPLGLDAAFFGLEIPKEHFVVTGPVEFGAGFEDGRPAASKDGMIESLAVKASQSLGKETLADTGGWQEMLRIGVRAVAAGEVQLLPKPAGESGAGTLLRGIEPELPGDLVSFLETGFEILPAVQDKPHDVNGDGVLTARDALVVINFLGNFGSVSLSELPAKMGFDRVDEMFENQASVDAMMRYDTNGNGMISAMDALLVINRLALTPPTAEAEEEVADGVLEQFVPIDTTQKVDKI